MTNDIVAHLRSSDFCSCEIIFRAADRIEQLEAHVARLRTAMDDVASYVSRADYYYMQPQTIEVMRENRAALEGK